jgi:hypothetical protein
MCVPVIEENTGTSTETKIIGKVNNNEKNYTQIQWEKRKSVRVNCNQLLQRIPRVVTGEKNSPTVAHACRKRRLNWVLGAWGYNWATQSPGDINMETWSSRLGVGEQG